MRLQQEYRLNAAAFSRNGKLLVTASSDGTARIWVVESGHEIGQVQSLGSVRQVAISPNGQWFVTAAAEKTGRIWDLEDGGETMRLEHSKELVGMYRSVDGRWLATNSQDEKLRVWDLLTGREQAEVPDEGYARAMAISPDNRWLVTSFGQMTGAKTTRIRDLGTLREHRRLLDSKEVTAILVPDSQTVITSTSDETQIWDLVSGRERAHLVDQKKVHLLAASRDNRLLATGSYDGTACIRELANGKRIAQFQQGGGMISVMAISPDGQWLAAGGEKGHVWNVQTRREVLRLMDDWLIHISFSPDGGTMMSAGRDGTIKIWDTKTWKQRAAIDVHGEIFSLVFSPDGQWIAGTTNDNALVSDTARDMIVRVWAPADGTENLRMQLGGNSAPPLFVLGGRALALTQGPWVTVEFFHTQDMIDALCQRVTRNLTPLEWSQYLRDQPYRRTCQNITN